MEAKAKKLREEAAQQRAAEDARLEQQRREEAERLEKLRQRSHTEKSDEPFDIPDAMNGFILTHSYPDVGFFVPDGLMEAAKSIPPHKQLTFFFDPENPHDKDAVGIEYKDTHIGYMYKGRLRDWIVETNGDDTQEVLGVSCQWDEKPTLGLYFYLSAEAYAKRMTKRPNYHQYTLTRNASDEIQCNIGISSVGERLDVEFDPDAERYVASSSMGYIGAFPTSADDFLSTHGGYEARILEISERETGKYAVKVMVAPDED